MQIESVLTDLLILLPLFLFFFRAKQVKPIRALNEDYLSLASTKALRGICALCIVFHHMTQNMDSGYAFRWFNGTGHLFVTIFFFLSGYGLMKQHMTREDYHKKFLLKRLPSVVFPFFIALAVYLLIESTFGTVYPASLILLMIFRYGNVDPFVPYAWYLILIFVFYIVFRLLMLIFRKHYKLMVAGGLVWFVCHVILCHKLNYGGWWYVTAFVLVIGMAWAAFEQEILSLLSKYYWIVAPIVWALLAVCYFFHDKVYVWLPITEVAATSLTSCFFAVSVVLILMKVKIGNRPAAFLGEISLEIYLCQGLAIRYLRSDLVSRFVTIQSNFLWCVLVILLTILFAFVAHQLNQLILKGWKKLVRV